MTHPTIESVSTELEKQFESWRAMEDTLDNPPPDLVKQAFHAGAVALYAVMKDTESFALEHLRIKWGIE